MHIITDKVSKLITSIALFISIETLKKALTILPRTFTQFMAYLQWKIVIYVFGCILLRQRTTMKAVRHCSFQQVIVPKTWSAHKNPDKKALLFTLSVGNLVRKLLQRCPKVSQVARSDQNKHDITSESDLAYHLFKIKLYSPMCSGSELWDRGQGLKWTFELQSPRPRGARSRESLQQLLFMQFCNHKLRYEHTWQCNDRRPPAGLNRALSIVLMRGTDWSRYLAARAVHTVGVHGGERLRRHRVARPPRYRYAPVPYPRDGCLPGAFLRNVHFLMSERCTMRSSVSSVLWTTPIKYSVHQLRCSHSVLMTFYTNRVVGNDDTVNDTRHAYAMLSARFHSHKRKW